MQFGWNIIPRICNAEAAEFHTMQHKSCEWQFRQQLFCVYRIVKKGTVSYEISDSKPTDTDKFSKSTKYICVSFKLCILSHCLAWHFFPLLSSSTSLSISFSPPHSLQCYPPYSQDANEWNKSWFNESSASYTCHAQHKHSSTMPPICIIH